MKARAQLLRWIAVTAMVALTGCANMYVDGNTKEIATTQFKKVDAPHPVQVLFEFQTKGVANARATEKLKDGVLEQVKASNLFSSTTEGPAEGGALLSITLNNVVLTDDAAAKGFMTGLTFGLAGTQVTDGYICTVRYRANATSEAIVKEGRHALHTTLGASSAPQNATKANSPEEAVTLMRRQVVSNVLNDLSHDATFK